MAYLAARSPRNRLSAGVAVIAIQALFAYGVITALTVAGVIPPPKIADPTVTNVPLPPMPTPTPTERARNDPFIPKPAPTAEPTFTPTGQPTAQPTGLPSDEFSPGPGTGPTGSASATPSGTPSPTFQPKAPRARGNTGDWVTANDYPSQDLREGNQGLVRLLLGIGADGRVTSCSVTGSSGFPRLDTRACDKLRAKGRFDPASDESGAKTVSTYRTSVRWTIPR